MDKTQSRRILARVAGSALCIILFAVGLAFGSTQTCPKCGAPLEPGALFCSQCGAKVSEGAASVPPAGPDSKQSLVQVVAIHDKELTSVWGAMFYGSTVRVDTLLGTAFAIAPDEFVTDAALLLGAQSVSLRNAAGHSVPAKVLGVDPLIGVGLLAADLPGVPPLPRRDRAPVSEGESLTALGFSSAGGMAAAIVKSPGVLSAVHRDGMGIHPVEDYIQTDASLPQGFAGGPAVDSEGCLLGMSTAFPFGRQLLLGPLGIGLFVPTEWLDRSVAWIRAGRPPRVWIGAHVMRTDADSRKLYSLPGEIHWVVEDVFPGSPAAVGLRRGDGLLQAQGRPFSSLASLHADLLARAAGEKWALEVFRDGKRLPVEVTLTERPDRPRLAGPDALRLYGGMEIGEGGSPGLVVTRVSSGTEAAAAKLVPGDTLLALFTKKDMEHVDRADARWRSVKDLSDLEEQIQRAYSDLDFVLGLKFRCKDGEKRKLLIYAPLTATNAL